MMGGAGGSRPAALPRRHPSEEVGAGVREVSGLAAGDLFPAVPKICALLPLFSFSNMMGK